MFSLKKPMFEKPTGLSIRRSLLLGFIAMSSVMILATFFAIFSTKQISYSMADILDQRLPAMLQSSQVAKAVNELTVTGTFFKSANTENELQTAELAFEKAVFEFEQSLISNESINTKMIDIQNFALELTENLKKLDTLAKNRIDITKKKDSKKEQLLSNLQTFKRHLTYRVRIIEADNDLINFLLSQPTPPVKRISILAQKSAQWSSIQRFYREIETISRHALSSTQEPTLSALSVSQQILINELHEVERTFKKQPSEIHTELNQAFFHLKEIILSKNGLLALRKQQLLQEMLSQNLLNENQRINKLVGDAASNLERHEISETKKAGLITEKLRQKNMLILLLVTAMGLLSVGALVYFHLIRNVISRLSWLSEAMQSIAAGKLDTPLPPEGNDEIGRLSVTIRQFQKTAFDAKQRETDLRLSNQLVEKVNADLKQKSQELETINNQLEKLSITDFLTGLANRRRFDESLETEWVRAQRTYQSLTVIMIDVDHFKKFNDRYGHQAGDLCLKKIADTLVNNAGRAGELVARYGGEEFCIISPNTDLIKAMKLAEKIRLAIQSLSLPNEDTEMGIVTISLGISVTVPIRGKVANDLVALADKALYTAKKNGRNQSVSSYS
jgi:diguanylate cyclase (GGDEF)-like protein